MPQLLAPHRVVVRKFRKLHLRQQRSYKGALPLEIAMVDLIVILGSRASESIAYCNLR